MLCYHARMDALITVPQAAKLLGLSESGIHKRIERGDMRAERLGGKVWVIPREEVERWQQLGRQRPGRKPHRRPDAGRE